MNPAAEAHAVAEAARKAANSPLAAMTGLSLLAHILLAAAITIEQPAAPPRFPDDARVALITPRNSDPEIIEWITSNDPANVFGPRRDPPPSARLAYTPSFDASAPAILPADPPGPGIVIPALRKPGEGIGVRRGVRPSPRPAAADVVLGKAGRPAPAEPPFRARETPGLEALAAARGAAFLFRADTPGMPAPLVLPAGSSGSPALDALGARLLRDPARGVPGGAGLFRLTIEPRQNPPANPGREPGAPRP